MKAKILIPHRDRPMVCSSHRTCFKLARNRLNGWLVALACAAWPWVAGAAEKMDESKLPPPASVRVDFARNIKPIFENTCSRCHGTERPKSHFSLITRASALKGGSEGIEYHSRPKRQESAHLLRQPSG